jgi:hypothetical protein
VDHRALRGRPSTMEGDVRVARRPRRRQATRVNRAVIWHLPVAGADLEPARARATALASAWWIVLLNGSVAVSLVMLYVVVPDALLLALSIACVAVYGCALFCVLRARAWLRAHPPVSG